MTTIDSVVLIALGTGVIIEFMKDFVRQLASIPGLIVGLLTAETLYTPLAVKLCPTVTDFMIVVQMLAFVIIWIAVPSIFTLVASALTKAMEAASLGWLNCLLGAELGTLKYLLLMSLVVCVIRFIDTDSQLISQTKKEESLLYYPMERSAGMPFPTAKEITQQHILK